MDRRQALKTIAGLALAPAVSAQTLQSPAAQPIARPPARQPQIIVFSQNLIEIDYPELGDIVKQMGFDGVDLTVRPGGHVDPNLANVDLVRAVESIQGQTLSVPIITTALTTPADPTAGPVLGLAGMSRIPLFRPGTWTYGTAPNVASRIGEVQRELAGLLNIGRHYGIGAAFYNQPGQVGATITDGQRILAPLDPAWSGFYFDAANAVAEGAPGNWESALKLALPRIKAISLKDFDWEKQAGDKRMRYCPLGQGIVEWHRILQILAHANFSGPVTIEVAYPTKEMPSALARDLEFARKQIQSAWSTPPRT